MLMNKKFSEEVLPVLGITAASASLTGSSACVNIQDYRKVVFLINRGADSAKTFTTTIIVEACSAQVGTNNTAIPFYYKEYEETAAAGIGVDLPTSNLTLATSAGFVTNVATSTTLGAIYVVEIDEQAILNVTVAANQDIANYKYVRVTLTTAAGSAPIGSVIALMCNPKFQGAAVARTVLT